MIIPEKYTDAHTLRDKVLYVLSVQEKGSANEVAMEIMELEGISTEEGVADLTREIEKEMARLREEGMVEKLKEHRQKVRYVVNRHQAVGH